MRRELPSPARRFGRLMLVAGLAMGLAACQGPVFAPAEKPGESLADVLAPGGKPIGAPDTGARLYEGGGDGAFKLFKRLTDGAADITPAGFPGFVRQRADGTKVIFLRPLAGEATYPMLFVQVAVPGKGVVLRQISFPPGLKYDGGGEM